jgi:hypothetical protein
VVAIPRWDVCKRSLRYCICFGRGWRVGAGVRGGVGEAVRMVGLVEVMKPLSAWANPEFRAKAQLARKSETDCRGPIWRVGSVVATGFVTEVGDAGVVGRREYEGLLGKD